MSRYRKKMGPCLGEKDGPFSVHTTVKAFLHSRGRGGLRLILALNGEGDPVPEIRRGNNWKSTKDRREDMSFLTQDV